MAAATATPSLDETPNVPVLDLFSLRGQAALVTGANRGIGSAIAIALAQAGAHVILVLRPPPSSTPYTPTSLQSIQEQASSETISTLQKLSLPYSIVYADIADKEHVKTLLPRALEILKAKSITGLDRISIVVHAAGIQRRNKITEFKDDDWEEVINVNLSSAFYIAKAAAQHMIATSPPSSSFPTSSSYTSGSGSDGGGKRGGKIILLGSLLTFQGGLTVPAYAAAKGGIGQLTKSLSNELSKESINVNCICPGYIRTDMNEALLKDEARMRDLNARIPAGRWGNPWDFAGPVVWLASEASKYVCGECVVVDGGWMGR